MELHLSPQVDVNNDKMKFDNTKVNLICIGIKYLSLLSALILLITRFFYTIFDYTIEKYSNFIAQYHLLYQLAGSPFFERK
jgi:hypothetical protein